MLQAICTVKIVVYQYKKMSSLILYINVQNFHKTYNLSMKHWLYSHY